MPQAESPNLYMLVESEPDNMVTITVPADCCGSDLLGRSHQHLLGRSNPPTSASQSGLLFFNYDQFLVWGKLTSTLMLYYYLPIL